MIPELWQQVEKLVDWQAALYYRCLSVPHCDLEDLKQAGFIGMMKAVESFDIKRGFRFTTLLNWYLLSAFQVTAGQRRPRDAFNHIAKSADEPLTEDSDTTVGDMIEDPRAVVDFDNAERRIYNEQLHAALENVLQCLDQEDAEVIRKCHYEGQTLREIDAARYKRAMRQCRSPKMTKELRQFLDDWTPSRTGGLRPTEEAAIIREKIAMSFR